MHSGTCRANRALTDWLNYCSASGTRVMHVAIAAAHRHRNKPPPFVHTGGGLVSLSAPHKQRRHHRTQSRCGNTISKGDYSARVVEREIRRFCFHVYVKKKKRCFLSTILESLRFITACSCKQRLHRPIFIFPTFLEDTVCGEEKQLNKAVHLPPVGQ